MATPTMATPRTAILTMAASSSQVCFITNFVTWAYARLYVFPVHVIYHAVMTASLTLTLTLLQP